MITAHSTTLSDSADCWPVLRLADWKDTYATLHMWTQIVGKIRLELTPKVNHWWNVPLYVSPHGLTTSLIPYGNRHFDMEFDFLANQLMIRTSDSGSAAVALAPRPVADFYNEVMAKLRSLGIEVKIWKMPVEVAEAIPFDSDTSHNAYDAEAARRLWRILLSVDAVFSVFRSRFLGKSSPVHFFWGSFDLAVTRFSGRRAPARSDPDPVLRKIMQEAYSHEVISAGWWPGSGEIQEAAFYCYAAPAASGFAQQRVCPSKAFYHSGVGEYLLMYDDVRQAKSPTSALMEFLQSTYEAGATTGKWDRAALEAG
ncbi:MAG TPA: DUF5996 family protein [Candidatus Sulfotelmatobacter sp.]|nr:DUF5996 family protein [Candidatus Sulfotelmatobacter sp.]